MSKNSTRKRVLIADGDRWLVDALASRFEQCGLAVIRAFDAKATLLSVLEDFPDLICIDVSMPAGGGLTACQVLAKDEEASKIPVIVMTGSNPSPTRHVELCAYYLAKTPDIWRRMKPIVEELVDVEIEHLVD